MKKVLFFSLLFASILTIPAYAGVNGPVCPINAVDSAISEIVNEKSTTPATKPAGPEAHPALKPQGTPAAAVPPVAPLSAEAKAYKAAMKQNYMALDDFRVNRPSTVTITNSKGVSSTVDAPTGFKWADSKGQGIIINGGDGKVIPLNSTDQTVAIRQTGSDLELYYPKKPQELVNPAPVAQAPAPVVREPAVAPKPPAAAPAVAAKPIVAPPVSTVQTLGSVPESYLNEAVSNAIKPGDSKFSQVMYKVPGDDSYKVATGNLYRDAKTGELKFSSRGNGKDIVFGTGPGDAQFGMARQIENGPSNLSSWKAGQGDLGIKKLVNDIPDGNVSDYHINLTFKQDAVIPNGVQDLNGGKTAGANIAGSRLSGPYYILKHTDGSIVLKGAKNGWEIQLTASQLSQYLASYTYDSRMFLSTLMK